MQPSPCGYVENSYTLLMIEAPFSISYGAIQYASAGTVRTGASSVIGVSFTHPYALKYTNKLTEDM